MKLEQLTQKQFEEILEGMDKTQAEVLETLTGGSIENLNDIENVWNYGCGVGVSGFIYYNETKEFFDDYSTEIFETYNTLVKEGYVDPTQFELSKNDLTWLYVEQVVREFMLQVEGMDAPACSVCGDEDTELIECENCGELFCSDCGDGDLCDDCIED